MLRKRRDYDVTILINAVFPDIIGKASEKVVDLTADKIDIEVKFKQPSGGFVTAHYTPLVCLRERNHPRCLLKESDPQSEIISFSVNFESSKIIAGQPAKVRPRPAIAIDEAKFDEFWKLCLELENENEIYKRVLLKQDELPKESRNIFNELEKRIVDIIP
jgi:hypothetical protein